MDIHQSPPYTIQRALARVTSSSPYLYVCMSIHVYLHPYICITPQKALPCLPAAKQQIPGPTTTTSTIRSAPTQPSTTGCEKKKSLRSAPNSPMCAPVSSPHCTYDFFFLLLDVRLSRKERKPHVGGKLGISRGGCVLEHTYLRSRCVRSMCVVMISAPGGS